MYNYHGKDCNVKLTFISPKCMFWGLNFRDERRTVVPLQHVGNNSLYSWLVSQHPTVLLYCCVSKKKESQKNPRQECYFTEKLTPFFSLCTLLSSSIWSLFSVRKCRAPASSDIWFWEFVIFKCNLKESKNVYVFQWITKERSLSGIIICNLAIDWRLKEEESFVFKQTYFPYYSVFPLGHVYDAEWIHTCCGRWQQLLFCA